MSVLFIFNNKLQIELTIYCYVINLLFISHGKVKMENK